MDGNQVNSLHADAITARIAATNPIRVLSDEEWFRYWVRQLGNVVDALTEGEIQHLSTDFDTETRLVTVVVIATESLVRVRAIAPNDSGRPELVEAQAVSRGEISRLEIASLADTDAFGSAVTYGTFRATVGDDVFEFPVGNWGYGPETLVLFEAMRKDLVVRPSPRGSGAG